jgi:CheY-like chemotaxis protein/anti-sigma regulatory factor (Ser/Thr protein kinase)
MLNTLLDFSRIEAGAIRPCCQDFELQAIFNRVERELAPQADALGLAYRTRDTTQAVHSDPALVELILRNLVANAIRYTPRGGLLVASRRRGDEVWMEVWDTGVGIAPQDQAAVFREFHQVGSAGAGRRKGFGLGLAICEGLAHALHHRLWLNSTPRRGSVFRLALPAATAAPLRRRTRLQQAPLPAGLRVLVLDDDELARTGMVGLLRSWGCQCPGTGTIATALALARQQRPDVLVCDFQLEGQATGLQAMTLFRQTFRPPPAMLLVTGDTDPQRLHDAKACAALLLRKPVPEALLRQGIAAAMDASRMPSRT